MVMPLPMMVATVVPVVVPVIMAVPVMVMMLVRVVVARAHAVSFRADKAEGLTVSVPALGVWAPDWQACRWGMLSYRRRNPDRRGAPRHCGRR